MPHPFDLEVFCREVARRRGRPLELHPVSRATADPCGMWIATGPADHVWYEQGTSPLHQRHIVVHELAHMLLGHERGENAVVSPELLPGLDPAAVEHVLSRTSYTSDQEHAAETLAGMILTETEWTAPPRAAGDTPAGRLDGALRHTGHRWAP